MPNIKLRILLALTLLVMPIVVSAGVGPREAGWDKVVPGSNPMTAEQAASTLGAIYATWNLKDCSVRADIKTKLLNVDIRAGGNEPKDFAQKGKYYEMVRKEAFFHRDLQIELENLFGKMGDPCEIFRPNPYLIK